MVISWIWMGRLIGILRISFLVLLWSALDCGREIEIFGRITSGCCNFWVHIEFDGQMIQDWLLVWTCF